jgi:hypothetical protein
VSKQSITELRALAQSMGCKWSFADDINALKQKVAMRQTEIMPPVPLPVVAAPDDQRLRIRPPSKISEESTIRAMIQPYISLGLSFEIKDGQFFMSHGKKTDSGTLRQPPRAILDCARRLME